MKRLISVILTATIAATTAATFQSCSHEDPEPCAPDSSGLKGIWEIDAFRMDGSNLSDVNPMSYIIIDPDSRDIVLIMKGDSEKAMAGGLEALKMLVDGNRILTFKPEHFTEYQEHPDESLKDGEYEFNLFENDDVLYLSFPARLFLAEEGLDSPREHPSILMFLHRNIELERKADAGHDTKGIWDSISSWVGGAVDAVLSIFSSDPPERDVNVHYGRWENTGWNPMDWMGNLPDDMLVCQVNIPGSHDSATATCNMPYLSILSNADCQDLLIVSQYYSGARYFDFRVGMDFVWDWSMFTERVPNHDERLEMEDLYMYHGPYQSGAKYKETLTDIGTLLKSGKSEFVFINTQWENNSYGLVDSGLMWLEDKLIGDAGSINEAMKHATMEVTARLQKEVNSEFGNELFINYRPDLTVGEARGHIILLQERDETVYDIIPSQVYVYEWPDNRDGFAHICTPGTRDRSYRMSDPFNVTNGSTGYNTRIQSYYEMQLDDETRINIKKEQMKAHATQVTAWNMEEGKRILGFNAMNANTGSASLKVDDFAHIFNGHAFDMFVENMLEEPAGKRFRCGIVPMDYFGAARRSESEDELGDAYGDLLAWAVIESNFY